ncbi:MAG TPA: hypothetical protein VFG54_06340 [Prolixibacteraceae bacterium]|nr:hypothetical protein [Prolixibacteraceae bacterium]
MATDKNRDGKKRLPYNNSDQLPVLMESELTQGIEKVKVGLEEKPSDKEAGQ